MNLPTITQSSRRLQGPHLPPFPEPVRVYATREDREATLQKERQLLDEIIDYLAQPVERVHPARSYRVERRACNSSLLSLAERIICNIPQIATDFFCCGFCPLSDREPQDPTFMPRRQYEELNEARVNLNRNTAALVCVGPAIAIATPLVAVPATVVTGLSVLNGMSGLVITGCMTYFWGDFGAKELAAYEHMKVGFQKVSEYLLDQWSELSRSGSIADREAFIAKCRNLAKNYNYMLAGMVYREVSEEHAKDVLKSLAEALNQILLDEDLGESSQPLIVRPEVRAMAAPIAQRISLVEGGGASPVMRDSITELPMDSQTL